MDNHLFVDIILRYLASLTICWFALLNVAIVPKAMKGRKVLLSLLDVKYFGAHFPRLCTS